MQSQMEAKLASMSLKSPGMKSGLPASPTARNFSANRQSLALDNSSNYLSPDSAAADAAATLAQRRAELKASNAAHRISAPVLASAGGDGRTSWGAPQLSQVTEQAAAQEVVTSSRPKSTEFSGTIGSPRPEAIVDSWASMVNTPSVPMFPKSTQNLDAAANKLNEWASSNGASPGVPRMGDPTVHRRNKPLNNDSRGSSHEDNHSNNQSQQARGASGGLRNASGGWSASRSPALSNSNRFGGNDDASGGPNSMNGLGMQMGAGGFNMGSPAMGMGLPGLAGMAPLSPFNMNMLSAMGISPEAQLLAAQMAASQLGQTGAWLGMQPLSPASQNNRRGPPSGRSAGLKSASSTTSRGEANTPKGEEDVDPTLLNDVPAWLRSLRLHKYTPNFEGMKWQDMVSMDEAQLEAKGVAALGARRKMLKTFEVVRKKMGLEGVASAPPSAKAA